jgi:hypothetical protein
MSNHFPTPPTSYNLVSIAYLPEWTSPENLESEDSWGGDGTNLQLSMWDTDTGSTAPLFDELQFGFNTAGNPGDFDQDTVEGRLADTLDGICTGVSAATGSSLATVQSWLTVSRQWFWVDADNAYQLRYTDTMTYPS